MSQCQQYALRRSANGTISSSEKSGTCVPSDTVCRYHRAGWHQPSSKNPMCRQRLIFRGITKWCRFFILPVLVAIYPPCYHSFFVTTLPPAPPFPAWGNDSSAEATEAIFWGIQTHSACSRLRLSQVLYDDLNGARRQHQTPLH